MPSNSPTIDFGGLLASLLRADTKASGTVTATPPIATTSLATTTTDGESSSPTTTDEGSSTSSATHSQPNSQTTSSVVSTTLSHTTPDFTSSTTSHFSLPTTTNLPPSSPPLDPLRPDLSATPTTTPSSTSQPIAYQSSGVNLKIIISAIVVPIVLYVAIMLLCWRYFVMRKHRHREQGTSAQAFEDGSPRSETMQATTKNGNGAALEDGSFILPIDTDSSSVATTDAGAFNPTTQLQNIPSRRPSWKQCLALQRQPPHAYPEDSCLRDEEIRSRRGLEMSSLEDETLTRNLITPLMQTPSSAGMGSIALVSREEIMRDPKRRRGVDSIDVMDYGEWGRGTERGDEGVQEMVEERMEEEEAVRMMGTKPERTMVNWFGKEGKGGLVVAKSRKSSEELERKGYESMNIELIDEESEHKLPDDFDNLDQPHSNHQSLHHPSDPSEDCHQSLAPHHATPRLSSLFDSSQGSTSFPPSEMYQDISPARLRPHPEDPPETRDEKDLGSSESSDDSAPKRSRNLHRKMADLDESAGLGEIDLGLGWSRRQKAREFRALDEYRTYKLKQMVRREGEKEEGKGVADKD
ncbi:hypothetical protein BC937DRAFT_90980 [Endogone sp. FLAS-F59071]|nr:hypothetical protein BC937DRAFT_90980 [Endogone sp. FLAS-F59071]|eukprot:RUS16629.1 hypothetical protein BC937DRAFT_90980 [Endogone sp. FLAS-F59071]